MKVPKKEELSIILVCTASKVIYKIIHARMNS